MKQFNKTKMIILFIIITFFSGINIVNAADSHCNYVLPYSAMDITASDRGKQIDFSTIDYEDITNSKGNNRFNEVLSFEGTTELIVYPKVEKAGLYTWDNEISELSALDYSVFSESCPKYIQATTTEDGLNYNFKKSDENAYKTFLKSSNYVRLLQSATTSENSFNQEVFNITKEGGLIVLPLFYDSTASDQDYDFSSIKIYNDTFSDYWSQTIDRQSNKLKEACGDNWTDYINISKSKYAGGQPKDFIKYMMNGPYDSELDQKADESCLNQRRFVIKTWIAFYDYWYTLLQLRVSGPKYPSDPYDVYQLVANIEDTQNVYTNDLMLRKTSFYNKALDYFNYPVLGGTKRITDNQDEDGQQIETNTNQINHNNDISLNIANDLCSGYCTDNLKNNDNYDDSAYKSCTYYNGSYTSCRNDLSKCKSECNCDSQPSGAARTACQSTCNSTINTCMENKGHKDAIKKSEEKRNEINEVNTSLNDQINSIIERRTFRYEKIDLAKVEWGFTKYEPNCKDVRVLTEIWSAMRLIAPFLLIIFVAFDYFKVVMSGDEEKMKQAKKKIPLRFIAFILLIFVPLLLDILLTNFGTNRANNTTYFKCILTGDKGESE